VTAARKVPGATRVTLALRPANRIKLRRLGGAKWLRATLDILARQIAAPPKQKRVQTCVRLTQEQRITLLRYGGADFLDSLIEGANDERA